ncbi:MAG: MoaD/ThiS family protein [Desulfurococcales archaeon]|nr:MoaD/ThiS family protein [Desulfurococcales archaeon]
MARIKTIGWLKDKLGFEEKEFKLEKPVRLEDFLPILKSISEQHVIVIVNGKPATKNSLIRNNDEVVLMPMTSGG